MYHVLQRENASIIQVDDDLDIASAPALASAINLAATATAEQRIIVSLEQCTFCDSTGLGVFATAKKRLEERFVVVLPLESRIRRVFNITGLTEVLRPYASLNEAFTSPIDAHVV